MSSAAAVATLVSRGAKARATAATSLNDRSSRSHAILIFEIEASQQAPRASGTGGVAAGRAGSGNGAMPNGNGRRRRGSIADCVSIGKMQVRKDAKTSRGREEAEWMLRHGRGEDGHEEGLFGVCVTVFPLPTWHSPRPVRDE